MFLESFFVQKVTSPRAEIFYCQPNTDRLSFLPVELFKQPLELLVVHVFLLIEDLVGGFLFAELLFIPFHLNNDILFLSLQIEKL